MIQKLFTLSMLLLASVFTFGQSLSLSHEGTALEPFETVTMHGEATNTEMVIELDVTNTRTGNDSIAVLVKKVENYLIEGSENTFCWGLCFPPWVYEAPSSIYIVDGTINEIDFSGHYNPKTNPGESSISYVFWDEANPNDSVMVTVLFTTLETAIGDELASNVTLSEPYPNPANDFVSFDYELESPQAVDVKIYSLVGSLVQEYSINNGFGNLRINTDRYVEGLYFFSLYAGGKELKSGKFIVRH
ncbi:MAG: T9SS type A sorting domain-containing protein [Bacteroidales bacterium]